MIKEPFYKAEAIIEKVSRYKRLLSDVNQNLTSVTFTTAYNSYIWLFKARRRNA